MKILLTGASGFLGGHLLPALLARGHEVAALSRRRNVIDAEVGARWVQGDLTIPEGLAALPPKVDAVVHLAQSEVFRDFPERAREIFSVNTGATLNLLDYARNAGAQRFVFASTGNVYGPQPSPIPERGRLDPSDFYGATKLAAELLMTQYARFFETAILRLFTVYGPGQQPTRLVPRLVETVRAGRPVVIDSHGGMRVCPTHVEEVVEVIARLLELKGSSCVNVAGPEAYSVKELADIIGSVLGVAVRVQMTDEASSGDLVPDLSLMRRVFPPLPCLRFPEGIKRLLTPMQAALTRQP